jgi:hypothetical protein
MFLNRNTPHLRDPFPRDLVVVEALALFFVKHHRRWWRNLASRTSLLATSRMRCPETKGDHFPSDHNQLYLHLARSARAGMPKRLETLLAWVRKAEKANLACTPL